MMQAFVSGMAARVAFVHGTDVSYINADQPTKIITSSFAELKHIFLCADDVEQCKVKLREDAYPLLLEKFNFDRGLHLLDIALTDEDDEFRCEAAVLFEQIMDQPSSFELIKNYVWAAHNENFPLESDLLKFRTAAPKFVQFVEAARKAQVHCLRYDTALEQAFKGLKIDDEQASEFRFAAIETGVFRCLVEAGSESRQINTAILKCYTELASFPNSRLIVQAWTKDVVYRTTKTEMKRLEKELERYEDNSYVPKTAIERSGYENYMAVKHQMTAIVDKVRTGDYRSARRFTDQLINIQLQNGGAGFAAKTLSSLAIEARKMEHYSLELEWAETSVELAPTDGRGVGILADTYLRLLRVPQAEDAFSLSIDLGEVEFGKVGLGRVQRACGKFNDALATFTSVKEQFAKQGVSRQTLSVYAETLRDMWREEDALQAYEDAIREYPDEPELLCGKAAVLTDLGRLSDAADIYEFVNKRFGEDPAAWCGLAHVKKLGGAFDDALRIYKQTKAKFPDSLIAHCGHADALRSMVCFDEALEIYREAKTKFPFSPSPVSGEAEVFKDQRNFTDAISILRDAQNRFPLNPRLRNGFANALKLNGQFDEALRQFDLNVHDFPYDLYSLGGRANLLRLLGQYEDALSAYDNIVARRPDHQFARNAMAAIFVAQRRYEEAEFLLPTDQPLTEVDWGTMHIRGMSLLRQGFLDEAKSLFIHGSKSPFFKQRVCFNNSLAVVNMKLNDLESASKAVHNYRDSISQLLSIHILLKLGDKGNAVSRLSAMNDNLPEPVARLRSQIGQLINVNSPAVPNVENDLFEQEMEVILQAA